MTTTEIFIKKLNDFKSKIIISQRKETTAGFLLFKDYLPDSADLQSVPAKRIKK